MQHCGVKVIASPEKLRSIDQVFGIEGEPAGLHGPLDSRSSDTTGARSV
jgi:hypothetical protein